MKSKKAISPLIATVLIIGFTVALAAVIMTWGSGFIEKMTKGTEASTERALKCATQLNFDIKSVDCAAQKVTIDNRGGIDIVEFRFRVHQDDGTVDSIITEGVGVEAYGVKSIAVPAIDHPIGTTKVEAIALIAGAPGEELVTCGENMQEFNNPCL